MGVCAKTKRDRIAWRRLSEARPKVAGTVCAIKSKADYERAVRILDVIIDKVGPDTHHPLASLAEVLGTLIESYEGEHLLESRGSPAQVLRYLMEEHKLRQCDLPEVGSQGVVSEILRGKRRLNARQVRELSQRFHVTAAVFLG
jgi:HTH-type transcriptional regulator / antitoxin HigA